MAHIKLRTIRSQATSPLPYEVVALENSPFPARTIPAAEDILLDEKQLAARWGLASPKKLQADRCSGNGCPFVRIGRAIRYQLSSIVAYEQANLRNSTSEE